MKNPSAASPPGSVPPANGAANSSLPALDYPEFRRRLLSLTDPERRPGAVEKADVKDVAIRLCSTLAHLFGESLDRMTLWGRIGTAFSTSCSKVSDDDLDRFCDLCLEHVQADPGKAAACDAITQLRQTWAVRPAEWRHAMLNYLRTHAYAVLTHGRARWEEVKAGRTEL